MSETQGKGGRPYFRIVVAAVLDFITAFLVLGYGVAATTGNLTDDGFQMNGAPALLTFVLIALYFWIGSKYLGGTLWQRILRVRRA